MNTQYVYSGGSAQVGELKATVLWGKGPSSYSQTNGDAITNPGSGDYIAFASPTTSLSGNYDVCFTPLAVPNIRAGAKSPGVSGWVARYFYNAAATNLKTLTALTIANAGSGYTPGTYIVTLSGGTFTRAATVSLTVSAGGTITVATVVDPGIGYSGSPTVPLTALGAGSSGSVTVTLTIATVAEVPALTNLGGELFQFGAHVTQL